MAKTEPGQGGVRSEGAISEREALELILQACAAVGEAHRYGIVHRDLKPANLFLSRRGDGSICLKVLDYGISKVADDGEELTITETDRVLGSPLYTAPEQLVSARDVDGRRDIQPDDVLRAELRHEPQVTTVTATRVEHQLPAETLRDHRV